MTLKERIAKVIRRNMWDHIEPVAGEFFVKAMIDETAAAIVNEVKEFIKDAE